MIEDKTSEISDVEMLVSFAKEALRMEENFPWAQYAGAAAEQEFTRRYRELVNPVLRRFLLEHK